MMSPLDNENEGGSSIIENHLASFGAIALFTFVLLKTYAAAKFSLTTASALLTTAPVSVLLGTITSYDYYALPFLFVAAAAWYVSLRKSDRSTAHMLRPVALAVAIIAGLLAPLFYLVLELSGLVVLLIVLGLRQRRLDTGRSSSRFDRIVSRLPSFRVCVAYYSVAVATIILLSTLTNLWMPVEVVTVRTATEESQILGHVLSSEGDWTTILTASSRAIVRVHNEDVVERHICHYRTQAAGRPPLYYSLLGRRYSSPNRNCTAFIRGEVVT